LGFRTPVLGSLVNLETAIYVRDGIRVEQARFRYADKRLHQRIGFFKELGDSAAWPAADAASAPEARSPARYQLFSLLL
jgi:hypothetical protein